MAEEHELNFLEKVLLMIERHGTWKVIRAILVIGLFLFVLYKSTTIGDFVTQTVNNAIVQQHNEQVARHDLALEMRRNAKPEIESILQTTLKDLHADRAFILEMHNGTNNTSGLPFIYGEMTYEAVEQGTCHIDEDYSGINLSRFNFPVYLEKNRIWMGTIDQLAEIDDKLALRMKSNDAVYTCIVLMHGVNNELGYFGVSYCSMKNIPSEKEITRHALAATQRLSTLLDAANTYETITVINEEGEAEDGEV